MDFFDLKGVVEVLLSRLQLSDVRIEPVYESTSLTDYHVRISVGETLLGIAGRLQGEIAEAHDLDEGVYFAELSVDRIADRTALVDLHQYSAVSRHPLVERDLAFVLDAGQEVGPVIDAVKEASKDLLRRVRPFDLYTGPGVPDGRKSVAFALVFGADRTLTDQEVDQRVRDVVATVRERFKADLRA